MIVIGLTGGIASGKSTVSRMLSRLGATLIDADRVGHEALRSGSEARGEVIAAFSNGILDQTNEVDRGKLAEIVFNNPQALEQLNKIMHPRMRRVVEQRIKALRRRKVKVVILEAALLIEANWTDLVDQVWVVAASEATVINRLREQKGFTEDQARARLNAQMSIAERVKHAHVVIENDADIDTLEEKVLGLWQALGSLTTD